MPVKINGSASGGVTLDVPAVAGTNTITLPAGTGTAVVNGVNGALVSGTAQASTSGTTVNFTDIPSWVKRITVMFQGVSLSGTAGILIQLGTSGGIVSSGYISTAAVQTGTITVNSNSGFAVTPGVAATETMSGNYVLCLLGTNTWTGSGLIKRGTTTLSYSAGEGAIGGTVTQLRITTTNGTDTFDAGTINIMYE